MDLLVHSAAEVFMYTNRITITYWFSYLVLAFIYLIDVDM